jgi:hypothetical protein
MMMKRWRLVAAPRCLTVAGIGLLVLVGAVVWRLKMAGTQSGSAGATKLETIYTRCVQDMVANTCKVMGTSTTSAKPGDRVFIAGVGAIAATDYQQMYEAGDAMCSVVRAGCAIEWDGRQCLTARKLWKRISDAL